MNFKTSKITSRDLGPNGRSYTVKLTTAEGDSALVGGLDWDVALLIAAAPTLLATMEACAAMLDPKRDADAIILKAMENAIKKAKGLK